MTEPERCEFSDLPAATCAHCLGDAQAVEAVGLYVAHVPRTGRVVGLGDYTGRAFATPRNVKPGPDSEARCSVPGCTRPSPDRFACWQCAEALAVALGNVPALLEDLGVSLARLARFEAKGGRGGNGTPLPYSERAGAAMRTLTATVVGACVALAGSWPREAGEAGARWLLGHLGAVARHPMGGAMVAAITNAATAAQRVIDAPAERQYLGLCPACRAPLHAEVDALTHRCQLCGEVFNVPEMLDALRGKVRELLVTTTELLNLQGVLGVKYTRGQVHGYVHRRRLVPHGNRHGTALYSVGEFLDLIEPAHAEHP